MIFWFYGNSGAGKTTAAKNMMEQGDVLLDGDEMRASISTDLGLSEEDRWVQNMRVARLAKLLNAQLTSEDPKKDRDVIVALITPYRKLRETITELVGKDNIMWMYMEGGEPPSELYPFEIPQKDDLDVVL